MTFARQINKIPEFYMIYAGKNNKMSKFYMIFASKYYFFPNFAGQFCFCPPFPAPVTPMTAAFFLKTRLQKNDARKNGFRVVG